VTCLAHNPCLVRTPPPYGADGAYFANYGDDVHVVGSLDPLVPGHIGCIVIRSDGSRYMARAMPEQLAHHKPD
jgi:hypothetical protein